MDQYFTKVDIEDNGWRIGYPDKIMLMGSCFTDNIGEKLQKLKFQVDINPFGIIYNPLSISKSIRILLSDNRITSYNVCYTKLLRWPQKAGCKHTRTHLGPTVGTWYHSTS